VKTLRLIAALPLLLASCAKDADKKGSPAAEASGSSDTRTSEERFNDWAGGMSKDNGYVKDANGNLVPKSNKRSQFESKGQSPNFAGKDFKKKEYNAGDYSKKSFWGNKEYDRKAYGGNTDGSRFQQASRHDGQGAREAGNAADVPDAYNTANYDTNSAREAGGSPVAKPSNAAIDNRQKVFQQPEIIGWEEQRKLSLDQSKGILGN